jgi:hypothetical protein
MYSHICCIFSKIYNHIKLQGFALNGSSFLPVFTSSHGCDINIDDTK